MKTFKNIFFAVLLSATFFGANATPSVAPNLCPNKFPDFINDVCWSCMFPFKVFGAKLVGSDQEDFSTKSDNSPLCLCIDALKVGVPVSFWEMSYIVDVHTEPGCLPTLGGFKLGLPWGKSEYGVIKADDQVRKSAFRHSAYYVSPMMYLLQAVLDDSCSDRSAFDVGWTSEFDPTWNDDELALVKMPISYAFASIPGVMAAGVDAAAANVGFPINSIFWQAGSWGPIYPLTGNVKDFQTMDQTGHLLATRMLAEAHGMREMANLFSKGGGRSYACEDGEIGCSDSVTKAAMCAGSPLDMPTSLIMKKKQYKLQRLFPQPYGEKKFIGGCCVPIGRTTSLRDSGTQLPTADQKDYGYAVFRKRDCCSGVVSPASAQ